MVAIKRLVTIKTFPNKKKKKGTEILVYMIERYVPEYKYLAECNYGSGVNQNKQISLQILAQLNDIIKIFQLSDNSFSYFEEDGLYFREKDDVKEEIEYLTFRTNKFVSEYLEL